MADTLKIHTDRRTSAKRYFLNGKRISWHDAAKLINSNMVTIIHD